MLLTIEEDLAERLKCLTSFPNEVIEDFCRVSIDGIFKPISSKIISSAAERLRVGEDMVGGVIQALTKLFVEAVKLQLNKEDISISIEVLGFPEDVTSIISAKYGERCGEIRGVLVLREPPYRIYKDLQWRLDVKMASRSLYDQCQPDFLMKLHTRMMKVDHAESHKNKLTEKKEISNITDEKADLKTKEESIFFLCNPATLAHISHSLEQAVHEVSNSRIRKVVKHL